MPRATVTGAHADAMWLVAAPACSTAFSRHTLSIRRASLGRATESVVSKSESAAAEGAAIGRHDGDKHAPNTPWTNAWPADTSRPEASAAPPEPPKTAISTQAGRRGPQASSRPRWKPTNGATPPPPRRCSSTHPSPAPSCPAATPRMPTTILRIVVVGHVAREARAPLFELAVRVPSSTAPSRDPWPPDGTSEDDQAVPDRPCASWRPASRWSPQALRV